MNNVNTFNIIYSTYLKDYGLEKEASVLLNKDLEYLYNNSTDDIFKEKVAKRFVDIHRLAGRRIRLNGEKPIPKVKIESPAAEEIIKETGETVGQRIIRGAKALGNGINTAGTYALNAMLLGQVGLMAKEYYDQANQNKVQQQVQQHDSVQDQQKAKVASIISTVLKHAPRAVPGAGTLLNIANIGLIAMDLLKPSPEAPKTTTTNNTTNIHGGEVTSTMKPPKLIDTSMRSFTFPRSNGRPLTNSFGSPTARALSKGL